MDIFKAVLQAKSGEGKEGRERGKKKKIKRQIKLFSNKLSNIDNLPAAQTFLYK